MWMGVSDDIGHFKALLRLKICLVSSLESSFPHSLPCLTGFFCKDKTSLCLFLSNFSSTCGHAIGEVTDQLPLSLLLCHNLRLQKADILLWWQLDFFCIPLTAKSDLSFSKSAECLTPSAVWCVRTCIAYHVSLWCYNRCTHCTYSRLWWWSDVRMLSPMS